MAERSTAVDHTTTHCWTVRPFVSRSCCWSTSTGARAPSPVAGCRRDYTSAFFDDATRRGHAAEQVLIEAFVPEAAVQSLDEAILSRLSRRDLMPFDAGVLLPLQDRLRRQLGAVAPTAAAAETAVRAAFRCRRAPVEAAMASQSFSRM